MLVENTLMGEVNKVEIAIERLRQFEPPEGFYLAFSGGKDSICIYQLALMSGVKFDAHYNFVGVEAPEVLKFIKDNYPDVIWDKPEKTMWQLIEQMGIPPTRLIRYCCAWLKERGGEGRTVLTGIRWAESNKRKQRKMVETCYKDVTKSYVNPIIDWAESDVWQFIRSNNFKYPCLYDEGYKRVGCVMCPMQTTKMRIKDMNRYPNFKRAYLKAFGRAIIKAKRDITPDEMMSHWIYGKDIKGNKLFEEEQIFNYE
jgi:phosphoadenosine phosphosulfate reductase